MDSDADPQHCVYDIQLTKAFKNITMPHDFLSLRQECVYLNKFLLTVFHNSRQLYRFNHSEHSLDKYIEYVKQLTGIEPENISVAITDQDYQGKYMRRADIFLPMNVIFYVCIICIVFDRV